MRKLWGDACWVAKGWVWNRIDGFVHLWLDYINSMADDDER